jgi:hypothetical protein
MILASDKKAWPLYLSIGNIHSSIRNKPSKRAWVLVAYLPTASFLNPKPLRTTLEGRLFHQCLDVILAPLKAVAKEGVQMVDSLGDVRHCFPKLAAYLADYPEQLLINVAAGYNSPTTTASFHDLGDACAHPPRTREWILDGIKRAKAEADPENIDAYKKVAKLWGLNGVHKPFWRDMPDYQPELCVAPDILHGLHRFWRDHILQWVIFLVGKDELDKRVKAIQPIIGTRHFKSGISHLSQWTGKEDRELQRILFAVIVGAPKLSPMALRCLRQFHEFLYLAQYRSHNPDTLEYMRDALTAFHRHKGTFIKNGARLGKNGNTNHFCIPKLAALHSYIRHIPEMGSSPQFSTEITENCHQSMAKQAYRATNKRDFETQMCYYLDRTDRVALTEELRQWHDEQEQHNSLEESIQNHSSNYQELARSLFHSPDEPMTRLARRNARGHIWHNVTPHMQRQSLQGIAIKYRLVEFLADLKDYLDKCGEFQSQGLSYTDNIVDVWFNCRIQLPLVQDDDEQAEARTVQALPPSDTLPYGRGSCVLVFDGKDRRDAESTRLNGSFLPASC